MPKFFAGLKNILCSDSLMDLLCFIFSTSFGFIIQQDFHYFQSIYLSFRYEMTLINSSYMLTFFVGLTI